MPEAVELCLASGHISGSGAPGGFQYQGGDANTQKVQRTRGRPGPNRGLGMSLGTLTLTPEGTDQQSSQHLVLSSGFGDIATKYPFSLLGDWRGHTWQCQG